MRGIENISDVRSLQLQHDTAIGRRKQDSGFAGLLQEKLNQREGVQFSKHAAERISQRGVEMSDGLLTNLNQAIEKARDKGAKDVVVIGAQSAFIVNVPNNIVITTMTEQEMKENIFTNIDSAVLI